MKCASSTKPCLLTYQLTIFGCLSLNNIPISVRTIFVSTCENQIYIQLDIRHVNVEGGGGEMKFCTALFDNMDQILYVGKTAAKNSDLKFEEIAHLGDCHVISLLVSHTFSSSIALCGHIYVHIYLG